MANDWTKMRTDLYRDPKVCAIADHLSAPEGELAAFVSQHCQCDMSVTRNVMRNATVGALVAVWGICRHRGKRRDSDLVLPKSSVSVLDDIADLPGFGVAMVAVGWVVVDGDSLLFPHFFDDWNVDPVDIARQQNAQRQQHYRQRRKAGESNVTRNVTVTRREEKRREENKPPLEPPPEGGEPPKRRQRRRRRGETPAEFFARREAEEHGCNGTSTTNGQPPTPPDTASRRKRT